jgi:hypothetical protein
MKKYPMASTRTICIQGALLHAVRLLRRNWDDERIANRLDEVYSCGTHAQYMEIIALAREGMRAARTLGALEPGDPIDTVEIPRVPR